MFDARRKLLRELGLKPTAPDAAARPHETLRASDRLLRHLQQGVLNDTQGRLAFAPRYWNICTLAFPWSTT